MMEQILYRSTSLKHGMDIVKISILLYILTIILNTGLLFTNNTEDLSWTKELVCIITGAVQITAALAVICVMLTTPTHIKLERFVTVCCMTLAAVTAYVSFWAFDTIDGKTGVQKWLLMLLNALIAILIFVFLIMRALTH
jgi:hypothetical protein